MKFIKSRLKKLAKIMQIMPTCRYINAYSILLFVVGFLINLPKSQ